MSEGYIDLNPLFRAIDSVRSDVHDVKGTVNSLSYDVRTRINALQSDLEEIKRSFTKMIEENRRQAALQRALTEIIRVRQELERDYGNYKNVRNTMIGILEATDLKLVRQTTMATCTEELMLATPRYWLAPVVIALSAWISDNKPLATRALSEALRRDEEKTCLTFALICRRNKRTDACFEWLSRYFAKQKANDMKESIIAYIDAYTNGVFGEDKDNLCEEYIERWMQELQESNENFEAEQIAYWKKEFQIYCHNTAQQYPKLAECAPEDFSKMNDYVMRINAAPQIIEFFDEILSAEVNKSSLVSAIDNELIKLVKNYDVEEAPLREEEEYLTDIKNFKGDEARAEQRRNLRKAMRLDRKVNLADRLSTTILSMKKEDISAKKTSLRFMQGYIKGAFDEFIREKASDYPKEIAISTHGWTETVKTGTSKKALDESYQQFANDKRNAELEAVKNGGMIAMWVLFAICLVAAIVGFVIPIIALGVIGVIGAVLFVIMALVLMSKNKKKRLRINRTYDEMIEEGLGDIESTIKQILAMNQIVRNFNATETCNKLLSMEEK